MGKNDFFSAIFKYFTIIEVDMRFNFGKKVEMEELFGFEKKDL